MNVYSNQMQDLSHIFDSIGDAALAKPVSGFLSKHAFKSLGFCDRHFGLLSCPLCSCFFWRPTALVCSHPLFEKWELITDIQLMAFLQSKLDKGFDIYKYIYIYNIRQSKTRRNLSDSGMGFEWSVVFCHFAKEDDFGSAAAESEELEAAAQGFEGIYPVTLPETNIAPENGWLEYYFPFGKAHFQGSW